MMKIFHKYIPLFLFALLSAVAVMGIVAQPATALPTNAPAPPPLNWQPCTDAPARDCASLTVPLDYAHPTSGTTIVQLTRARATDSANYIGPLVVNFGGPGVAASDTIKFGDLTQTFSAEIAAKFDIIGFDPRGTTPSPGIECFSSPAQSRAYWEANHLPKTLAETKTILNLNQQVNQTCLTNNQPLVQHVDTASTVRDIEQLRRALHVEKFNFIGFSYGTFMGNRYAQLYPGHIRAMVLDAATDRGTPSSQTFTENTVAFEQGWQRFKQWCSSTDECQLKNQNIDAVFAQLRAQARTQPIPAPHNPFGNRPVNDWQLTIAVQAVVAPGLPTYGWIDEILTKAQSGDASLASLLYDSATGYDPGTNSYGSGGARRAISCVDTNWSQTLDSPQKVQTFTTTMDALAPRFGKASVYQGPAQCYKYPVAPVEAPPMSLQVTHPTPTLVVGATQDVSTPYSWSVRTAARISGSRLLTRQGDGHVSLGKSRCVEKAITDMLVRLSQPPVGATCQTDSDLYGPVPPPILESSATSMSPSAKTMLKELPLK